MKVAVLIAAAVVGLVLGGGAMLAVQASESPAPRPPSTTVEVRVVDAQVARESTSDTLLLAWTPGGLPPGLDTAARAVSGVSAAVIVRGDPLDLIRTLDVGGQVVDEPPPGWAIPLDVIAVDAGSYAAVVPAADRAVIAGLGPDEALLGATSARLRRIGPGGRLGLGGGRELVVVGVVPDETIGGAELAVDYSTGERLGVATPRALLVAHRGDRTALEIGIARAVPAGVAVRFRSPGETPYLRAGDAVLPQVVLKDVFGEFAYRPGPPGERAVEIDPAWVAANIARADMPILGTVQCHRAVLPAIEDAMGELVRANLADAIKPGGFDGCWVPRRIAPEAPLSHHSWGIAIDLNYSSNPTCVVSAQDPRLVEILERWGFGWGGRWLCPDPAHFEYVSPPTTSD